MAEIVLIHGIAQEQEGPASLEGRWLPAMADGLYAAGHSELADRLWPDRSPREINVAMATYGDLFLASGAQGSDEDLDDLDPNAMTLSQALAAEWLNRAADRGETADRDTAVRELGFLDPNHEEMGVKEEATRAVINAVTRLPWFGIGGMALAERFVNKSLRQVTRYLTDPALRTEIQTRVLTRVGSDTKIIIGHSLGSVIAYEIAATHLNTPLPLLLTLGSPLGLRSVIFDRLTPQPPVYPARVRRWVNIADRNDLVAAEPDLSSLFSASRPADAILDSGWTVDNGAKPHEAAYYLRKKQVGKPVAEALNA